MSVRPFRKEDAAELAKLSASCLRGETDFVLNPMWETEAELFAEFERHGIDPEAHLLVAEGADNGLLGLAGFLRQPGSSAAGLFCPIVERGQRGQGVGGQLLRAALELAREKLGIQLVTAGIGTRNRSGYALLTGLGFSPVRQHFLMRCDEAPQPRELPIQDLAVEAAKPEDADAILELYTAAGFEARSIERMREILQGGIHYHAVARHQGETVAFTELETHWPNRVWVAYVGVKPELRNQGLGSGLVGWALARQFEQGIEAALLMLSPANRSALRAYEKVGFRLHRTIDVLEKHL